MPISQALTQFDVFSALPLGLTKFTGPETKLFLQGQLTCNIDKLEQHHSLLGAHCDPKGKTLAVLRLLQHQDDVYALQDIENVETHLPNLKKYAIFSKVDITDASGEFVFTGLSGEHAATWLAEQAQLPSEQHDTVNSDFGLISSFPRAVAGHNRYLIVSSPQQAQSLLAALPSNITTQTPQLWKALDIISATPSLTPSCQGQHLPQMLNLHLIEGISYSKGCYIGQETVARMHYRGQNKRAMFVLSTPSQLDVKPGDNVERQVESGWRNAGTVISCQVLEQHSVLLAILPIDSKTDGHFRLKDSDETLTLTIADYFDNVETQ